MDRAPLGIGEVMAPVSGLVMAHGCFDLLHLGHIRHLQEAAALGAELVVSITSDRFASKAPGRPIFTAQQRAETLSALGYVSRVVINDAPTAEPMIRALRPSVYVKGPDYADKPDAALQSEREVIESYGGRVHFTSGETFSSSSLINRHSTDEKLRNYLASARAKSFHIKLPALVESISSLSVLFIGETIVDEYVYVSALGKPPKEFVVACKQESRETFSGGVVAAANHARSFVANVDVISGRAVTKRRYVDHSNTRKLFEVFAGDDKPLDHDAESQLVAAISERARDYDVVVVTDFGHGMMTPKVRAAIEKSSVFLAVNTQSNSANHGFNLVSKYHFAHYVCLDLPEARLAECDQWGNAEELSRVALPWGIITDGSRGSVTCFGARVPAFETRTIDTMGAGDAFLAITAPLASVADDLEMVAFIGNLAGAMKVQEVGHRNPVSKDKLLRYCATLLK